MQLPTILAKNVGTIFYSTFCKIPPKPHVAVFMYTCYDITTKLMQLVTDIQNTNICHLVQMLFSHLTQNILARIVGLDDE